MKIIAFFNNKGGVGKTSLVYHLAWMFSQLGLRVVTADLDPQSNLTSMFLDQERLEQLWDIDQSVDTIYGALRPIIKGIGDIKKPCLQHVSDNIALVTGDLGLALFEDYLSKSWAECADGKESAFRITTAFYRILEKAAYEFGADIILVDVGPNLGAINRSAMIAAHHIVIPMAADLFSLQGLKNLGPTLKNWRSEWETRIAKSHNLNFDFSLPSAQMQPVGYVLMQYNIKNSRPVKAYQRWMTKIPDIYAGAVLGESEPFQSSVIEEDEHCLSILKHYYSLMPLAMEACKPMFFLAPADGAIGAHVKAVQNCYKDFELLAVKILSKTIF